MTRVITTTVNDVVTYHITTESALPSHYGARANRRIGTHAELKNRVSLISEFEFSGASRNITLSQDGMTCAVSGEYPPMIKIFDLTQLSQETEFRLSKQSMHFEILTDQWAKLASLSGNRKLDFFDKGGIYHTVSLPIRCRYFSYNRPTADLILGSEESQLLRLNLEKGQFVSSVPACSQACNTLTISDYHQLIVAGYEEGEIEFFDPRDKRSIAIVGMKSEVTNLTFDPTGMFLAVGVASGNVSIFDIRSSKPMFTYSHRNKFPIHSLSFHNGKILSGDKKGCRIYDENGKFFTSFDTKAAMNQVLPYPDSGLIFATAETQNVQVMLIPDLGPAPRWASFLDNLILDVDTENETTSSLYEDKKFVTRDELTSLGMNHLVNSTVLIPYMHGFYIPNELYRLIKGQTDQDFKEWVNDIRTAKKEQEEQNKIIKDRKAPKKDFGDLEITEFDSKKKSKKKKKLQNDPYYQ